MSGTVPTSGEQSDLRLVVAGTGAGCRLDKYLGVEISDRGLSRSAIQALIKSGAVLVNGRKAKASLTVNGGEEIKISLPDDTGEELEPEAMELAILFEDDDLIVVDKPHGLVVHPGSGNSGGTLVNGLLHHCGGQLSALADEDRPGIVHRLDKDTSGCLVAAKTDLAYESLVSQFSGRTTDKTYFAVTHGVPLEASGTIKNQIGRHPVNRQKMTVLEPPAGKEAITDFEVVSQDCGGKWALVKCKIHTGRTHQIRVHMKESLRCPILGDPIYGVKGKKAVTVDRLMLHAAKLSFQHPVTGRIVTFRASMPETFSRFASSETDC